jgi:hypothetical protein
MLCPRTQRKGKRQRFYARNALKTTLDVALALAFGHLMRSFPADPATSHYTTRIHPALTSVADEICGTLARLVAYLLTLALLAIGGIYAWDQLPDAAAMEPEAKDWTLATRSSPAFAISQSDSRDKPETYEIFRHPEGGRKDVFRWSDADKKSIAELEIYRPGGEATDAEGAATDIAMRMDAAGARELEAAGIIDSKFGTVTLLQPVSSDAAGACLGFAKRIDQPNLRISGWTCLGSTPPARRAAISCALNRLILLTAGNDPRLAELFARAELKRGDCATSTAPALSADWVMGAANPRLRGAF